MAGWMLDDKDLARLKIATRAVRLAEERDISL